MVLLVLGESGLSPGVKFNFWRWHQRTPLRMDDNTHGIVGKACAAINRQHDLGGYITNSADDIAASLSTLDVIRGHCSKIGVTGVWVQVW